MAMRDYKFTLTAGVERSLNVEGNWFHVVDASGAVNIRFDEGVAIKREQGQGGSRDYKRVTVSSPTDQTITLALGHGMETDSRANVTANLAVTVAGSNGGLVGGDVSVNPGSQSVISALPERVEIIIKNPSVNAGSMRIASVSMSSDAKGVELEPGETVVLNTTGAVYVRNLAGNAVQKFSYSQFTRV